MPGRDRDDACGDVSAGKHDVLSPGGLESGGGDRVGVADDPSVP